MRLGLQLNGFDWNAGPTNFAATLADVTRAAEEAGFDRIGRPTISGSKEFLLRRFGAKEPKLPAA